MGMILITDDDKKTVIEYDNDFSRASVFYDDGRVEPVKENIFDLFGMFLLSDNNTNLPDEGSYKVILDNDTGFKHYFLDGKEDYIMFYNNNGEEYAIDYYETLEDNGWRPKEKLPLKEKLFRVGKSVIHTTFMGFLIVMFYLSALNLDLVRKYPEKVKSFRDIPAVEWIMGKEDYTVDDLINKIMNDEELYDEDKFYLANRDFFADILPYVNQSNFVKYLYGYKFNNIVIDTFDDNNTRTGGYYRSSEPNKINIGNSNLTHNYFDVLAHEFIHLCQGRCFYNLISEASAEIISHEYFDDAKENSYIKEVYLLKKMMEIIGPEPILKYVFANDFSDISNAIKPYLSSSEYKTFLDDLKRKNDDNFSHMNEVDNKNKSLDSLLDTVYLRKYGESVDNDPVISYLKNDTLVRYYFNQRKMDKEGSRVIIPEDESTFKISFKEAILEEAIVLFQKDLEGNDIRLSYDDYEDGNYDKRRML